MSNRSEALRKLFLKTHNKALLADYLEAAIKNNAPIALYKCAENLDRVEWIFDKDYIIEVLGGQEMYEYFFDEMPDIGYAIIFFFRKVGPLVPLFVEKRVLEEILTDLKLGKDF